MTQGTELSSGEPPWRRRFPERWSVSSSWSFNVSLWIKSGPPWTWPHDFSSLRNCFYCTALWREAISLHWGSLDDSPLQLPVVFTVKCRWQQSLHYTVSSVGTHGRHLFQSSISRTAKLFWAIILFMSYGPRDPCNWSGFPHSSTVRKSSSKCVTWPYKIFVFASLWTLVCVFTPWFGFFFFTCFSLEIFFYCFIHIIKQI